MELSDVSFETTKVDAPIARGILCADIYDENCPDCLECVGDCSTDLDHEWPIPGWNPDSEDWPKSNESYY